MGRPHNPDKTQVVHARISDDELAKLDQIAAAESVTRAELIRRIIRLFLARHRRP